MWTYYVLNSIYGHFFMDVSKINSQLLCGCALKIFCCVFRWGGIKLFKGVVAWYIPLLLRNLHIEKQISNLAGLGRRYLAWYRASPIFAVDALKNVMPANSEKACKTKSYTHWHVSTAVYKWWHLAHRWLSQFIWQQISDSRRSICCYFS